MQIKVIMKSKNIERINKAVVVLRHFIDLSSKLLPFLDEVNQKSNPSPRDLDDKQKIIEVYRAYNFDTGTSNMLMNSSILDMIQRVFEKLVNDQNADAELLDFDLELNRLRKNWRVIDAN